MKNLDDGTKSRKKKPARLPGPLRKLKDMDPALRDKYAARAVTAVVVIGIIAYAIAMAIPKNQDIGPGTTGDDVPSQSLGVPDQDGTGTGDAPGYVYGEGSGQGGYQENDTGGRDDGHAFRYDGYEVLEGQTLNAVDPSGQKAFKFTMPLGFGVFEQNGGAFVKPTAMDVSAQSTDPLYFTWRIPEGYDSLLESGKYDALAGREDPYRLENTLTAVDYYEGQDNAGNAMPVILAERTVRYAPDPDGGEVYDEDLHEYWILMCCQGQCFLGVMDASMADQYLSQRYPSLQDIVRTMVPPVSDSGFPSAWAAQPADTQDQPEAGTENPDGSDDGAGTGSSDGEDTGDAGTDTGEE